MSTEHSDEVHKDHTDHATVQQVNELSDLVAEIADGLFGPMRTHLQGGGRVRHVGAFHRLEVVENAVKELDKARTNGGVPAKLRVDWRDRKTQVWVAVITLFGTTVTAVGAIIAAWVVRGL